MAISPHVHQKRLKPFGRGEGGGGDIHFDSFNVYPPENTLFQSKLLAPKLGSVPTRRVPESNHLSGQRWHFSEVLLAQRRQMTLARCHLAHRANFITNRWFNVGSTPFAQQALHMPT